ERNRLGKGGLQALARSPHLRGLTRLSVSHDRYAHTVAGLAEFLRALDLPNLRHLALGGLPVGVSGAKALAQSPAFARLARLNLNFGRIGDSGLAALAGSPHLVGLISVELFQNRLGAGARVLADRAVWPLLSACVLGHNPIPRPVAKQIAQRPGLDGVAE
ncbi:MAG: hypothetical protein K2V38_08705, partial [Gemmataceae bacterium]|nr:hypothetical protein [Gemmataceae bacterium]